MLILALLSKDSASFLSFLPAYLLCCGPIFCASVFYLSGFAGQVSFSTEDPLDLPTLCHNKIRVSPGITQAKNGTSLWNFFRNSGEFYHVTSAIVIVANLVRRASVAGLSHTASTVVDNTVGTALNNLATICRDTRSATCGSTCCASLKAL